MNKAAEQPLRVFAVLVEWNPATGHDSYMGTLAVVARSELAAVKIVCGGEMCCRITHLEEVEHAKPDPAEDRSDDPTCTYVRLIAPTDTDNFFDVERYTFKDSRRWSDKP